MATLSRASMATHAHNERVISLLRKENPLLARVLQRVEGESFPKRSSARIRRKK